RRHANETRGMRAGIGDGEMEPFIQTVGADGLQLAHRLAPAATGHYGQRSKPDARGVTIELSGNIFKMVKAVWFGVFECSDIVQFPAGCGHPTQFSLLVQYRLQVTQFSASTDHDQQALTVC